MLVEEAIEKRQGNLVLLLSVEWLTNLEGLLPL